MTDYNTETRHRSAGEATLFGGLAVTRDDVKDVKDAEFIIPRLVVRGQSTVFIAEPNCGKTAVLVHLAPLIVKQGSNLTYMNFDAGAADIARHYKLAERDGYTLVAPDINVGTSIGDVLKRMAEIADSPDLSNEVFIIDTLKKCTDVINKQASKKFYETIRAITGKGGTVLIAGHANKYRDNDGKLIYEGTGDLRSDLDNMIFMEYQRSQDTQIITTYPDKTRAIGFAKVSFKMDRSNRTVKTLNTVIDVKKKRAVTSAARRNDPDGDIQASIKDAIISGKTIQNDIVKYCTGQQHPFGKVRKALKYATNTDNQQMFLTVKSGDNNSQSYSLIQ